MCLLAFPQICKIHLEAYPNSVIVPGRFNNDLAENNFCQTRGLYNGSTTHPSYAAYCATVNSVILDQCMVSHGRKGNNARVSAIKPYNFYTKNHKRSSKGN